MVKKKSSIKITINGREIDGFKIAEESLENVIKSIDQSVEILDKRMNSLDKYLDKAFENVDKSFDNLFTYKSEKVKEKVKRPAPWPDPPDPPPTRKIKHNISDDLKIIINPVKNFIIYIWNKMVDLFYKIFGENQ
jgi:hypothetical protein